LEEAFLYKWVRPFIGRLSEEKGRVLNEAWERKTYTEGKDGRVVGQFPASNSRSVEFHRGAGRLSQ